MPFWLEGTVRLSLFALAILHLADVFFDEPWFHWMLYEAGGKTRHMLVMTLFLSLCDLEDRQAVSARLISQLQRGIRLTEREMIKNGGFDGTGESSCRM